jgi:hypothetical protein
MTVAIAPALLAALLGILGDAYHLYWAFVADAERSQILDTLPYRAHGVLIAAGYALALLALPGLVTSLPRGPRRPILVGVWIAFLGTTFVAGDYWAESVVTPGVVASQPQLADADASGLHLALLIVGFGLHAIGWLLIGVGALRGGCSKAVAIVVIVGAVYAFTPLPGSNLLLFASIGAWSLWLHARARDPRPVA